MNDRAKARSFRERSELSDRKTGTFLSAWIYLAKFEFREHNVIKTDEGIADISPLTDLIFLTFYRLFLTFFFFSFLFLSIHRQWKHDRAIGFVFSSSF